MKNGYKFLNRLFYILNIDIQSKMSLSFNSYHINQNYQIKLCEILQSTHNKYEDSKSSYKLQSDSSILILRQGPGVDVFFCKPDFSDILDSLAIEGVKSLRHIRVTYFGLQKQAVVIYQKQNKLHFYRGKKPANNRSSINQNISQVMAQCSWDQNLQILEISQICLKPKIGVHCLITTNLGRLFLLQYNFLEKKLILQQLATGGFQSKIGGIVKYLFKPILSKPEKFSKCSTFLHEFDQSSNIFSLQLLDTMLLMKYLQISQSQKGRHQIISSRQVNMKPYLILNMTIINSIFVPIQTKDSFVVNLNIVCCVQSSSIYYYSFIIDLEGKIQKISQISNCFEQQKNQNILRSNIMPDKVEMFNEQIDMVDIEQFEQKICIIKNTTSENMFSSINRRNKMIAILQKTQQNQLKVTQIQKLRTSSDVRLLKLCHNFMFDGNSLMEEQNEPRLLLIGESSCEIISLNYSQNDRSVSQKIGSNIKVQKIRSEIPPIPSYDQNQQEMREENMREEEMKNDFEYLQYKNEPNHQYLYPYSTYKIQKYISNKQYGTLFEMLKEQKEQFDHLNRNKKFQLQNSYSQRALDQLVIYVLFGLFTVRDPNQNFSHELISYIFNEKLYRMPYFCNNQNLNIFIQNLFDNKDVKNLMQIVTIFFQSKLYKQIYFICVQSIPNFLLSQIEKIRMPNQKDMRQSYFNSSVECLKSFVKLNFLVIYEKLITDLFVVKSNPSSVQDISSDIRIFTGRTVQKSEKCLTQYELKQLLDKYLSVKAMSQAQNQQKNYKTQQLNLIFSYYLSEREKYDRFLVGMAKKHKNITLFDFLIKEGKIITKQDMINFLSLKQISIQTEYVQGILINLINKEIRSSKNRDSFNLKSLSWIPSQFFEKIYEYLINFQPKIAIMYGIKQGARRKVAQDIANKKQLKLFHTMKKPADILELYEPFYSCSNNVELKLNIDIARLLVETKYQFIQARQLISFQQHQVVERRDKISIQKQKLDNFYSKISYLNPNQLNEIKQHFK